MADISVSASKKPYRSISSAEQWKRVIFSDESHLEVRSYRSLYIRRNIGEPTRKAYIQQATKHPPEKMFWGFFSASGPGGLIPIEGMMNSDKYMDIMTNYLMP